MVDMTEKAAPSSSRGEVSGVFNYCGQMDQPPLFCGDAPEDNIFNFDPQVMPVSDMRETRPTMEREGIKLETLRLNIGMEPDVDVIARIYRPILEEYLRGLTGAAKIKVLMPMVRWSDRGPRPERTNAQPATYVHADFSRDAFHERAAKEVADDPESERWLAGRYAVFQTWRALSPPPQDLPLALLERQTIAPEDVVVARNIVGRGESAQHFFNYTFRHNPAHRWAYCSDMTEDDMLLFIGFDSQDDTIPGIPHAAFDYEAASGRRTHPRMSCELRAFVYWG